MTATDDHPTRQLTVNEAIASVIGYLSRQSLNLAVGYVNQGVTESSLDDLRVGLGVMAGRLGDIVQAIRQGETHLTLLADEL
jgi:hypothetical protein